ncbi:TPA: hypothetical protein ACH3X1_014108 [Trebouxia sp. C0004]
MDEIILRWLLPSWNTRWSRSSSNCNAVSIHRQSGIEVLAGMWQPGGSGFLGLADTSLGDVWVLNPVDFDNGVSGKPGYVVRPVVTGQTGQHVEIGLSCSGCTLLSGTTGQPGIVLGFSLY